MSIELWGILGYVVAQLLVASLLMKKVSTEQDYFLAGRSLGPVLATFSIFATWFGAESCMGSAGLVFSNGLSGGKADPLGYAFCLLLFGLIFAARLWKRNLTTLGDLYRERYSVAIERFAVLVMIPTSIMWAAAQMRAFGQILSASSGMEVTIAISIATGVVILYTAVGGLMADCVNDFVHGICLIIGLAVLVVLVVVNMGGIEQIAATLTGPRMDFMPDEPGVSVWQKLDSFAIPVFGSLVAQELISRSLASRSAGVARTATLWGAGVYLVIGLMPVFLGLIGPAIIPDLQDPEQLLPALAHKFLPTFLYIIFAGALVAAILSTVDSALLAVSALFSHNIVYPLMPDLSEKKRVSIARLTVFVSGAIAYLMAIFGESIYELVQMASSWGSAGLVVITTFGLFSRFGSSLSAGAALITGLVGLPIGEQVLELDAPYLFALAVSASAYVAIEIAVQLLPVPASVFARVNVGKERS